MLKKGFVSVLMAFLLILIVPKESSAEPVDFTGGIKNEYTYEEYVFITGSPIKFTASGKDIKVTVSESNGKRIESYNMKLKEAKSGATITRNFTYTYDISDYMRIGQSTFTGEVTKYSEKMTIGTTKVELVDYQFSNSAVTDNRPASDYSSGNVNIRKTYKLTNAGGTTAEVNVYADGQYYGYENFWGSTKTQLMNYEYIYWNGETGVVSSTVSHSKSKLLNYEPNLPSLSSFDGGYSVNSEADTISEYSYQLPNGINKVSLKADYMPRIERLIVPKFRDLSSHWAKENIEKLYSLGIFDDQSNFFSPNTPMMRYDFAVAIGKALDLRVEVLETKKNSPVLKTIFKDVKRTTDGYEYLMTTYDKGVINGTTATTFEPRGVLTRQQAATIIVRALGLEGKAPDPGFATDFKDDNKIQNYARDSVYVANELGIMIGSDGYFNPNRTLTRAESAAIIERFLRYLENDLKQNYRDDILFFEY